MKDSFKFFYKMNPYLIFTAQQSIFDGDEVIIAMHMGANEHYEEFIKSRVYKGDLFNKLIEEGTFIILKESE